MMVDIKLCVSIMVKANDSNALQVGTLKVSICIEWNLNEVANHLKLLCVLFYFCLIFFVA